jgi:hypothetical protein
MKGSSKLVILMIWHELAFLLQNNKILHSLQHMANFRAFWNQLSISVLLDHPKTQF